MAQPKAAASRSKAAAARAEKNGAEKTVTWEGIEFTLPAKLPGTLLWDFATVQSDPTAATINTIHKCLGAEQAAKVRQKIEDDGVTLDEVVGPLQELLEAIFATYGTEAGE